MLYGWKLPHTRKKLAGEYSQGKVRKIADVLINHQIRGKSPFHFDFLGKSLYILLNVLLRYVSSPESYWYRIRGAPVV